MSSFQDNYVFEVRFSPSNGGELLADDLSTIASRLREEIRYTHPSNVEFEGVTVRLEKVLVED